MWSSIANLKENLNNIALDVYDDDEGLSSVYDSHDPGVNSVPDGRISRNFSRSRSPPSHSPIANGFDSPYKLEIEQYKADIRRLKGSEAEIKALSVNYAALLKEKEEKVVRLSEENNALKQNLHTANAALIGSKSTGKGTNDDQSSSRQSKAMAKNRSLGSSLQNGSVHRLEGKSNGIRGNEKEPMDLLDEKNRAVAAMQASHKTEVKQLELELDRERGTMSSMKLRLEEEQKRMESFQHEMNLLKVDRDKLSSEMTLVRDELHQKIMEIQSLQTELQGRNNDERIDNVENSRKRIDDLEKQNSLLKVEKDELMTAAAVSKNDNSLPGEMNAKEKPLEEGNVKKVEMEEALQKLDKELNETRQQRNKALHELGRLKQHLLDKEVEEGEKMDEDSKVIEELRAKNDHQRVQISHLEKALKQASHNLEEIKVLNESQLKKSRETINDLNRKMAGFTSTIEAKNIEVMNLQTALGQYYAEMEFKERLADDLNKAKEETERLSEQLKEAYGQGEILKKEKEQVVSQLSKAERFLEEKKSRITKLEEDNEKLRRALEQSMTRLNRMSVDSDFHVDRRIVIKLLVTYFQRNHSKEVLDLMARMLGFSNEDKQRIGMAQRGPSKGVVRGVFGLPGRLVGGILGGGSSSEASSNMSSDNQSFADLWVDFLLKETEKRESGSNGIKEEQHEHENNKNPNHTMPFQNNSAYASNDHPGFNRFNDSGFNNHNRANAFSPEYNQNNSPFRATSFLSEAATAAAATDSEFSTVSLSSDNVSTQGSRFLTRYS